MLFDSSPIDMYFEISMVLNLLVLMTLLRILIHLLAITTTFLDGYRPYLFFCYLSIGSKSSSRPILELCFFPPRTQS
jgi:hypothetical protein